VFIIVYFSINTMEDNNDETVDDPENTGAYTQLPVCCQLDSSFPGLMRVKRGKGKAFSSGGFGIAVSMKKSGDAIGKDDLDGDEEISEEKENPNDAIVDDKSAETNEEKEPKSSPITTHQYLFLEEVLFLFEQGLLECQIGDAANEDENTENTDARPPKFYAAPELYAMLKTFNFPMASYLVFAHLRQQTFRVLRYSPNRLSLLRKIEEGAAAKVKEKRQLHLELRKDLQQAPPPFVIDHTSATETPTFAFCVYNPSANFSKSKPGLPDFLVAVTVYGHSALDYGNLQALIKQSEGIPIKLATVADSGTVVMFGITDYGVPPLESINR
jgi:hypothetical protein